MAVVMNEKRKSFVSLDDEEDALLNEAISCSRNMEIKTDDDEEEEEAPKTPKAPEIRHSKLWCDITSDTSSSNTSHSDLSLSSSKMDLSNDNSAVLSVKEEEKDEEKEEEEEAVNEAVDQVLDIKCKVEDDLMEENAAETNGRSCKRIREDNDEGSQVPKNRRNSSSSSSTMSSTGKRPVEYETDPVVLARRQKDVDYGKNTIGYDRYIQEIPKDQRAKDHPRTPPMHLKCSRRAWDGMIKLWRKQLHFWDPKDEQKMETDPKDEQKMETDPKDEQKIKIEPKVEKESEEKDIQS